MSGYQKIRLREQSFSASRGIGSRASARWGHFSFAAVTLLSDAWAILTALWVSRLVAGRTATLHLVFAAVLFALLLIWQADGVRLTTSVLDDLGPLWRRVVASFAFCVGLSIALSRGDQKPVFWMALLVAGTLPLGRLVAYSVGRNALHIGRPKAVVLGAGKVSRQIVQAVNRCGDYSFDIIGVLDDDPRFGAEELGRPILGGTKDLQAVISGQGVSVVIVAFTLSDPWDLIGIVRKAQAQGASVWVVPRFFELGLPSSSSAHVWGLPLVKVAPPPNLRLAWQGKRALDVLLAGVAFVAAAPLMAAIAIAVRVGSGSPILYKQRRLSINGKEFNILKFRTMSEAPQGDQQEWAANPDRVSPLGRFLRDTSLDELPQLFNVMRGDMSLVGPRPERPFFVREFSNRYYGYDQRHRVPAGMTGWAQVNGLRGSDSPIEDRVAFDNYYIENWSLSEDLKIMARTLRALRTRPESEQEEPLSPHAVSEDRGSSEDKEAS